MRGTAGREEPKVAEVKKGGAELQKDFYVSRVRQEPPAETSEGLCFHIVKFRASRDMGEKTLGFPSLMRKKYRRQLSPRYQVPDSKAENLAARN